MKIYLGIKFYADLQNAPLVERVTKILETYGHDVYCVVRDLEQWGKVSFTAQELMTQSFGAIRESDLVLIELSKKGVGLGIEAGYAFAVGKPLVTIAQAGKDVSGTLRGISRAVFAYETDDDLKRVAASLERFGIRETPS